MIVIIIRYLLWLYFFYVAKYVFGYSLRLAFFVFSAFFSFLAHCQVHCSWDMNSAPRHMNSNCIVNNNFFIIFLLFSVFNKISGIQTDPKMYWFSWDKVCTPKDEGGLGFRDLKAFNLALLAKQGWRLQTNTSLKAKYFLDSDFLGAELGFCPSYAWRSILVAQNIVRKGYRWQVGNGTSINIWSDRWLNDSSKFRLLTRPNFIPAISTISELINFDTGNWHEELVRQTFIPTNVEVILSIPLSSRLPRDRLVWALTPKGSFTVKSVYKIAVVKS